jgi:hypothetical protein
VRAAKLYLPNGAFTFASRQTYRLVYHSQREAPHDRALRRAFKLRGKLGAEGGIGDYVPKPKWMRWPTYDRKLEEIYAAEKVVDAHLLGFVQARVPFETMKPTFCARAWALASRAYPWNLRLQPQVESAEPQCGVLT